MNPVDVLAAVGRAVGDGMTLAAEILCPRDHTAEDRLRSWETAAVAVEDEICDEAEAAEDSDLAADVNRWSREAVNVLHDSFWCRDHQGILGHCRHLHSSAADAAADPSPADANTVPRGVGDEGPEGASAIPPAAPSGHLTDAWYCHDCGVLNLVQALTDPGEVSAPSPGGQALEDDLAAHIMGDFVSGQEVDALTATLIDALSSRIASALLTDFTITRK